jgi:puromycin-sensitive aminopeptidase
MDTWIFQGGHPIISASADGDRLSLSQKRFRFLPDDGEATWAVPLLIAVPGGEPHKVLLDETTATVDLPGAADGVVLNAGGHGFYRVAYSPELLAALGDRLDELQPVERALLLDDTWAAVLAGATPASAFLDLAQRFGDETDPAVWTTLSGALGSLERILDGADRERFQAWVRTLARPALERVGWEAAFGESELLGQTRQLVLNLVGGIGNDADVQERARRVLDQALAGQPVDPNVAAAAVTIVAGVGTDADWERYVRRFRETDSPQEQLRYLYGLAGFPSEELAERTLAMTLDEIRTQNAPFVILYLLANREVHVKVWDWVKGHWAELVERFPDNTIPRMLGGVVTLSTPEQAADVNAFVAAHPVPQAAKTVEQHLERLQVNVGLRQREAAHVAQHLR